MERARPRLPWTEIAMTVAGIIFLAVIVLLVPELRRAFEAAIEGDSAEVRAQINGLGAGGPLLIVALTLIHTVIPFPAEIINAAAGFAFGFFPALALVTVGWMASALLCYAFGRSVARPLLDRWFGAERFERLEGMIERGGVTLLLAVRLIPIVPFSLAGYAAGAARVPVWRFFWTTLVGYMPITALAVYFGTRLEGLSLTDPIVFGSILAVIALLAIGHRIVRRQASREASGVRPGESGAAPGDTGAPGGSGVSPGGAEAPGGSGASPGLSGSERP